MRSRRKQKAERAGQRATPPSSRPHASTAPSGDQASADKPTPTRSSWTSARAHRTGEIPPLALLAAGVRLFGLLDRLAADPVGRAGGVLAPLFEAASSVGPSSERRQCEKASGALSREGISVQNTVVFSKEVVPVAMPPQALVDASTISENSPGSRGSRGSRGSSIFQCF